MQLCLTPRVGSKLHGALHSLYVHVVALFGNLEIARNMCTCTCTYTVCAVKCMSNFVVVCFHMSMMSQLSITNAPQQGMSPLMVACRMGVSCLDSIQLLLAHGADPNGPDKSVSEGKIHIPYCLAVTPCSLLRAPPPPPPIFREKLLYRVILPPLHAPPPAGRSS